MSKKPIQFEDAMKELESVVKQLEEGDVPLEKAIDLYKTGMELSAICQGKLQQAEKELISIIDENGQLTPFQIEEGGENNE